MEGEMEGETGDGRGDGRRDRESIPHHPMQVLK